MSGCRNQLEVRSGLRWSTLVEETNVFHGVAFGYRVPESPERFVVRSIQKPQKPDCWWCRLGLQEAFCGRASEFPDHCVRHTFKGCCSPDGVKLFSLIAGREHQRHRSFRSGFVTVSQGCRPIAAQDARVGVEVDDFPEVEATRAQDEDADEYCPLGSFSEKSMHV